MKVNGTPPSSGEGGRSAAASSPDPEVSAKTKRRRSTAAYKLSVVERADACETTGRDRRAAPARGTVQLAPVVVAEGGAGRVAAGAGEEAWTEALGREA